MIDIVIFSSDSFMPRTRVCIESCKEFIPEAKIHLVPFNRHADGDYISGLAKARLEYTKKLLEEGSEGVMVLGADCVFYSRPYSFLSRIRTNHSNVVLIPHVIKPPKHSGAQLYQTGHVNADLMLFYPESLPILNWLIEQEMVDATSRGVFYEQTWLSALPFFFDNIYICKHPGINYAYFNFNERELTKEGDRYLVDGEQLKMVQYSGYIKGHPEKISKHWHDFQIRTPDLAHELFQDYEARISK